MEVIYRPKKNDAVSNIMDSTPLPFSGPSKMELNPLLEQVHTGLMCSYIGICSNERYTNVITCPAKYGGIFPDPLLGFIML
jgi:hypothetical protein